MSYSGIFAFGLQEERPHQCGQLLDTPQGAEGEAAHVFFGLNELRETWLLAVWEWRSGATPRLVMMAGPRPLKAASKRL